MKTTIKVARILTMFNIIVWGGLLGISLLLGVATVGAPMLIAVFLFSAIPLHSYASLQLQKSIRNPQVKLSNQTPAGVRFIGFVALFLGICTAANTCVIIADPSRALKSMETGMVETKGVGEAELKAMLQTIAGFILLMALAVIVNVVLNLRLLRWYYLVKQSDIDQSDIKQNDVS